MYIKGYQPSEGRQGCAGVQSGMWPWLGLLVLTAAFAGVHYLAFQLRFPAPWDQVIAGHFARSLLLVLLIKPAVFVAYGSHRDWQRPVSFYDLVTLAQAATIASLLFVLVDFLLLSRWHIPRSVFLIDWGATVVFVGGLRASMRWLRESRVSLTLRGNGKRVLIAAGNQSGEAMLRAIQHDERLRYHVIGFVAPANGAPASHVSGKPILGSLDEMRRLIDHYRIDEVLIGSGDWAGRVVRQLVDETSLRGVPVKVVPSFQQLLGGRVDIQPRQVSIEDLLRREPVQLDLKGLHRWLDGKTLLVTGSAGSIGSEICRQLLEFDVRRLVLLDRNETGQFYLERELRGRGDQTQLIPLVGDVCHVTRMRQILRHYQPQVIFHAAAYKHVPMMEWNPGEAVTNIVQATKVLADLAAEHSVEALVMISTDKAIHPRSVMGACKRVAELYVQALSQRTPCRFVTVRFGNVLDSSGSVIPIFRQQIAEGGPVTVTHPEMQRYFMMIPEASQLVLQAGAMGQGGEIFVLDMGSPVRILDLAKDMIHLSGLRLHEDIDIVFTGLRPGEKLVERLHLDSETHRSTSHPKIMIAVGGSPPWEEIDCGIQQLLECTADSREAMLRQLAQLVPEYEPYELTSCQLSVVSSR